VPARRHWGPKHVLNMAIYCSRQSISNFEFLFGKLETIIPICSGPIHQMTVHTFKSLRDDIFPRDEDLNFISRDADSAKRGGGNSSSTNWENVVDERQQQCWVSNSPGRKNIKFPEQLELRTLRRGTFKKKRGLN
jgi:hypothetical protein